MPKTCKVTFNGETFYANCGDMLLDGALMSGVEMPHDCRSGVCGACKVRLVNGKVYGGTDASGDTIYACQARVISDLTLEAEPTPDPTSAMARVVDLVRLAPDVVGVTLELPRPFAYLPGQYCKLQFRGFPARCYSPTYPLQGAPDDRLLHFHIRRLPSGAVSSALGSKIRIGHRVRLSGPFGSAFHRPNHLGRIVIVASGTGFAPMWSVAVGAITERPQRDLVLIVASRKLQSFYMDGALCRLALFPNVTIIPVVSEQQSVSSVLRSGRPTDYLPDLSPSDLVYTAGAPAMTEAVAKIAAAAGARCYTDPFVSNPGEDEQAGLIARVVGWFDGSPRKNEDELHAA
ncbi:2Fe-2S iron-sulfur cluster-binding protein [Bradyrhizobium sp. Tv2a-2]|uniref:2Fe-2S iron-sulfur cluster-binding protein n=1 Tax=Bradyrhizobium sp. Tv2a-2 TaxID=113395 RepID=UPI00041D9D85|nr:2Fe-2S iron-sulfur cluster-binding protein [Bradyrhizobium sp. Tv2a-2]